MVDGTARSNGERRARARRPREAIANITVANGFACVFHVRTAAGWRGAPGVRLCALCQDCFVVLCAAVVLCAKRTARTLLFKLNHFEIRFQSDWLEICNVLIGLTILCGTHTCLRHVLTIPVPPRGTGQANVEGTGLGLG